MTKVRLVNWPIARTTASRSALTKFSITVSSPGLAAFAAFCCALVPLVAGFVPRGWVCARSGAPGNPRAHTTAQAIGFIIASSARDACSLALGLARKSFISGSEVQNRRFAIAPAQQRNQPGELRLDRR